MADSSSEKVAERKRHSRLVDFCIRLVKEKPLGTFGAVITLLLLMTGIFADLIAPYGMNEGYIEDFLASPSAKHILGADNLGRDILSRVIFGARVSVIVGLSASILSTLNSLIIGVLSGYLGGKFDLIVQRFVDAWMCVPHLVFLMVIMSVVGTGMLSLIIVLGVFGGIGGSRVIRSAVIAIKEDVYVGAAVAIGCSTSRILFRHILPNIMAPAVILFTVGVPGIIMTEASLSFLGFGIPAPFPSWGALMSGTGRQYMFRRPEMALWPGIALVTVVYGINMFGDALRDLLDARLRGGLGRYGTKAKKLVKQLAPQKQVSADSSTVE